MMVVLGALKILLLMVVEIVVVVDVVVGSSSSSSRINSSVIYVTFRSYLRFYKNCD